MASLVGSQANPSSGGKCGAPGRDAGAGAHSVKVHGVVTVSEARARVGDDGRGPAAARVYRVPRGQPPVPGEPTEAREGVGAHQSTDKEAHQRSQGCGAGRQA